MKDTTRIEKLMSFYPTIEKICDGDEDKMQDILLYFIEHTSVAITLNNIVTVLNRMKPTSLFDDNCIAFSSNEAKKKEVDYGFEYMTDIQKLPSIIDTVFETLDDKESLIFIERTINGKTFTEIGNMLGLTCGRISQIYQQTLSKLKHPTRSNRLKGYLEAIESIDFDILRTYHINYGLHSLEEKAKKLYKSEITRLELERKRREEHEKRQLSLEKQYNTLRADYRNIVLSEAKKENIPENIYYSLLQLGNFNIIYTQLDKAVDELSSILTIAQRSGIYGLYKYKFENINIPMDYDFCSKSYMVTGYDSVRMIDCIVYLIDCQRAAKIHEYNLYGYWIPSLLNKDRYIGQLGECIGGDEDEEAMRIIKFICNYISYYNNIPRDTQINSCKYLSEYYGITKKDRFRYIYGTKLAKILGPSARRILQMHEMYLGRRYDVPRKVKTILPEIEYPFDDTIDNNFKTLISLSPGFVFTQGDIDRSTILNALSELMDYEFEYIDTTFTERYHIPKMYLKADDNISRIKYSMIAIVWTWYYDKYDYSTILDKRLDLDEQTFYSLFCIPADELVHTLSLIVSTIQTAKLTFNKFKDTSLYNLSYDYILSIINHIKKKYNTNK